MTMRRLHLGVLAAVVPALLLSLALVGCGGKEEKGTDGGKPAEGSKKGPGGALKAVEPGKGTLTGKVVLTGAKPDFKKLTDELLTAIKAKKDDEAYCLKSPEDQRMEQEWRIGDNNGVGNVFVWIEPVTGEFFKIDEAQLKAVPKEVTMDQPFCAFVPHCVVLFPKYRDPKNPKNLKETGQKFIVKNDATIAHNTKMGGGAENPEVNETLAPKKDFKPMVFTPSKEPITIRCNIHTWMSAHARAYDHPYAALTMVPGDPKAGKPDPKDPKYGTYEIKNVPAAKVRVIAWHPTAGYLNGARGEEIELKDGANTKDFSIKEAK
jgi:hypothetical protein